VVNHHGARTTRAYVHSQETHAGFLSDGMPRLSGTKTSEKSVF
jgi:hypothetical protein